MKLDGQIDLLIKFGEKTICERVYVNFNVPDTLLLSKNELAIITYHPEVQAFPPATDQNKSMKNKKSRIRLVRLPADSSALVQVEFKERIDTTYLML